MEKVKNENEIQFRIQISKIVKKSEWDTTLY